MKRKTGNRAGWPRIGKQQYIQEIIQNPSFHGYVTLMKFIHVLSPLKAKYTAKPITLVEDGSYMMQHIPFNEHYALTTFISPSGKVVQWYFDMTNGMGEENGIPFFDDLYLDLIVVPTGEMIDKDIDELEEALQLNEITKEQFDLAWKTFRQLKSEIEANQCELLQLTESHFKKLKAKLEKK